MNAALKRRTSMSHWILTGREDKAHHLKDGLLLQTVRTVRGIGNPLDGEWVSCSEGEHCSAERCNSQKHFPFRRANFDTPRKARDDATLANSFNRENSMLEENSSISPFVTFTKYPLPSSRSPTVSASTPHRWDSRRRCHLAEEYLLTWPHTHAHDGAGLRKIQ